MADFTSSSVLRFLSVTWLQFREELIFAGCRAIERVINLTKAITFSLLPCHTEMLVLNWRKEVGAPILLWPFLYEGVTKVAINSPALLRLVWSRIKFEVSSASVIGDHLLILRKSTVFDVYKIWLIACEAWRLCSHELKIRYIRICMPLHLRCIPLLFYVITTFCGDNYVQTVYYRIILGSLFIINSLIIAIMIWFVYV